MTCNNEHVTEIPCRGPATPRADDSQRGMPGYTKDFFSKYTEMSTDELLELLPSNLHLARNENAPAHDRWRVYNTVTEKHVAPGAVSCRDLLIATLATIDKKMADWTGRV